MYTQGRFRMMKRFGLFIDEPLLLRLRNYLAYDKLTDMSKVVRAALDAWLTIQEQKAAGDQ